MQQLRNHAVYQPPNGMRPVYVVRAGDLYYLYDYEYGAALRPRFTVRPDGAVIDWHGDRVDWTAEDLRDTGGDAQLSRTSHYRR